MTTINVGSPAISRGVNCAWAGQTAIDNSAAAVANGTGTLTQVAFYFHASGLNATGVIAATFSGSGTSWTYRASANIGNVTKGSTQTFTGLSIAVSSGDLIGYYATAGEIAGDNVSTGGSGLVKSGNHCTAEGAQTYGAITTYYHQSVYGTGATSGGTVVIRNKVLSYGRRHTKRMAYYKTLKLK